MAPSRGAFRSRRLPPVLKHPLKKEIGLLQLGQKGIAPLVDDPVDDHAPEVPEEKIRQPLGALTGEELPGAGARRDCRPAGGTLWDE